MRFTSGSCPGIWCSSAVAKPLANAQTLARLLRAGELAAVWVPDEAHEALRNVVRARRQAKDGLGSAKSTVKRFLLRHGRRFTGKTIWGKGAGCRKEAVSGWILRPFVHALQALRAKGLEGRSISAQRLLGCAARNKYWVDQRTPANCSSMAAPR